MVYKDKKEAQDALSKLNDSIDAAKEQAAKLEAVINGFDDKDSKLEAMEKRFIELMNGLTIKLVDRGINYYRGDVWIAELDIKNKVVWFRYFHFWSFFEKEFGLKYDDITSFTTNMVKKHLNCDGFTTSNGKRSKL